MTYKLSHIILLQYSSGGLGDVGDGGKLRCLHGKVNTTISCMCTCSVVFAQCSGCVVYGLGAMAAMHKCYYFFYTTVLCCTPTHRISFVRQSLFHSKNHIICTCTKVECRESVPGDYIQEGVSQEIEMFGVNDRKFQSTKQSLPMATFHFFLYGFNF